MPTLPKNTYFFIGEFRFVFGRRQYEQFQLTVITGCFLYHFIHKTFEVREMRKDEATGRRFVVDKNFDFLGLLSTQN